MFSGKFSFLPQCKFFHQRFSRFSHWLFTKPSTASCRYWPYQQILTKSSLISLQLPADFYNSLSEKTFCATKTFHSFSRCERKSSMFHGKFSSRDMRKVNSTKKELLWLELMLASLCGELLRIWNIISDKQGQGWRNVAGNCSGGKIDIFKMFRGNFAEVKMLLTWSLWN